MPEQYAIPAFIADVKQALAPGGPTPAALEQIAIHMRRLTRNPRLALLDQVGNVHAVALRARYCG